MGQSGAILFFTRKSSLDAVDGALILDASDDFDGLTAATTNFNIDVR